jgi:hypothetical protein
MFLEVTLPPSIIPSPPKIPIQSTPLTDQANLQIHVATWIEALPLVQCDRASLVGPDNEL